MLRQIGAREDRERSVGADLETWLTLVDMAEEKAATLPIHVHGPYFGSLRVAGRKQLLSVGQHAFRDLSGGHTVVSRESEVGGLFYSQVLSWQTPGRGKSGPLTGTIWRR